MECSWWGKDILDPGRLGNQAHDALSEVLERLPFPQISPRVASHTARSSCQ